MAFADTFCSSPWFHMRINNSGHYEYCRWANKQDRNSQPSIQVESPLQFFQHSMAPIRQAMLDGTVIPECGECHAMEQHHKVSGRQKQLLKTGVRLDQFRQTMVSSPWLEDFNSTEIDLTPQDWQIDLGNYCNSACIFCDPGSSSRLANEYRRIGIIDSVPKASWCTDPVLLGRFLDSLRASTNIKYLHFIGGETLITPAFRTILELLIAENRNKEITIGFTTNLTVWDPSIVDLLTQFDVVNLGMSIECLHPLNDYVRYGSSISQVTSNMAQWVSVARTHNWYTQLRITPTLFSVWHLDSIYSYAYANGIAVESCNFLNEPACMRPSVLPKEMRQQVITRLHAQLVEMSDSMESQVVNIRNPDLVHAQIAQDLSSYISYLESQADESHRLPDLIQHLQLIERSRNNSILDYLPEYEKLLRASGY